jgi:DNA polymerase I-like protein with 3'-5' exonuclease and polymerase domains
MQNFPKGRLFPVRLAFVSRFKGGKLIEVDYSQQEFRVAGILAKDARIKKEVESGFDVHSYTAKVLTDAGEPTERNPAKPYTFKPLYGGNSGTQAQREYFKEFFNKYQQVFQWHEQLQTEAVRDKRVTTATGRQFDFPGCHRNSWNGNANLKTQIVNYPVQSVATADLVPLGVIILHKEIKKLGLKSLVINTVHDSVLVDTHPDEIEIIKELAPKCLLAIKDESKRRFPNLDMDYIPLAVEGTIGDNWMNQEDF